MVTQLLKVERGCGIDVGSGQGFRGLGFGSFGFSGLRFTRCAEQGYVSHPYSSFLTVLSLSDYAGSIHKGPFLLLRLQTTSKEPSIAT